MDLRLPPFPSPLAVHWQHDPSVCFLNHGSFGGCPSEVLQAQNRLRNRMEAETIRFFVEDTWALMDRARAALGSFVSARAEDIVPIPNATFAVTTALNHMTSTGYLKPGDEILANDHEYPACLNNLRAVCARGEVKVVMAEIPFPVTSPEQVLELLMSKVTPRTKAALVSHVTSSSGLVMPVEMLVPELEKRGVRTIIDGAHGVGFLPLNLTLLNPSYYTSNCHKWLCAPKGSAFLWVRGELQKDFRPLVLSNFAEKPKPGRPAFHTEFDFVGTNDMTPFLTIPDAISFMPTIIPGGWPTVMKRNRDLTLAARDVLCRKLSIAAPAPDSMIACLATIPLPPHTPERHAKLLRRPTNYHDALQDSLLERWRIQVPIWSTGTPPKRVIRVGAQVYNSIGQYEYLAEALAVELERERAL